MRLTNDQQRILDQILSEYPTAGSLTLAKRLHRDFPHLFTSIEIARSHIRYRRGTYGPVKRRKMVDLTHVQDMQKVLADKFALPAPAVTEREPYMMPKVNVKGIVMGDIHFPYQDNKAIYDAIDYGVRKGIDYIILNGDCIDNYHASRFTKDPGKPSLDYELEMFWEFLINLRDVFPNALIIWKFGNHEERYDTYWKQYAPLLYAPGNEKLDDYLPLGDLNIQVVKDKRRIVVGDLNILHGHEYPGSAGGVNPARGMFLKARCNVLVNHFHRSSSHKGNDLNGNIIKAYSLGSMCAPQDYSPYGDQDNSFGYLHTVDGVTYVNIREVE